MATKLKIAILVAEGLASKIIYKKKKKNWGQVNIIWILSRIATIAFVEHGSTSTSGFQVWFQN